MEQRIYEYLLKNCCGFDNRVKGYKLMALFNIKDHKTLRSYIEKIRQDEECVKMVGSRAGKDGGYYIITNMAEFNDTVDHLYLRALETLKTCSCLRHKQNENQLKLEI